MSKSNNPRKLLTPLVTGVFVAATVVPSNSAITEPEPSTSSLSGPGIVIDLGVSPSATEPEIRLAFGAAATAAVERPLNGAIAECRGAGSAYAASCVAAAFKKAARAASKPDYRDARRELNKAAKKLEKLVSQNADKQAPKKKGKNGTYKAVKQAAIAAVKKEAIKIIQETETKLLRSSGSGARKVHYQRIAQAVGSTKVIFRS